MLINILIILVSAAIVVVAYAVGEERGYRQGVDDVLDELESEDCDCPECLAEELEEDIEFDEIPLGYEAEFVIRGNDTIEEPKPKAKKKVAKKKVAKKKK